MKLVTTFHQPSSVLASLKCQLAARDVEYLVVAKLNKLEVFAIKPEGLRLTCGLEIWGTLNAIHAVPIQGSAKSNIVLLIGHPDPELIFFSYIEHDSGAGELVVIKQLSLFERAPRPAEFFNNIIIHPSGKVAVVSCYTGKLKVVVLKAGNYENDFDVSSSELNLLSLQFLPTSEEHYTVAMLFLDYQERLQLLARDLNIREPDLSKYPSVLLNPTIITTKAVPSPGDVVPILVPVPPAHSEDVDHEEDAFLGGVLVIGGKKLLLYELTAPAAQEKQKNKRRRLESKKKSGDASEVAKAQEKEREREAKRRKEKASVEWPWSEVTAWCPVDTEHSKYLIGDSFGKLAMLSLDNIQNVGPLLIPLGETSAPTTLTYLTNQIVYVGSHMGDSQLIRISPTPVSSFNSPTLQIPPEIKTVSVATLLNPKNGKGKGRAIDKGDDMDIDEDINIDDDSTDDVSKGRIIETKGSFINVIESYRNIAPILDAIIVDTDGSGQRQIVTCSGSQNTGSVNLVRNGADFRELAFIPGLTNVSKVWGVRAGFVDKLDSHVLVSTTKSSLLFKINDSGDGGNITFSAINGQLDKGMVTDQPTLAFANVTKRIIESGKAYYGNSSLVVQVTPTGAYLLDFDSTLGTFTRQDLYVPGVKSGLGKPSEVVAASINPSQVALALTGGKIVILSITDKIDFRMLAEHPQDSNVHPEVSAISCIPLDPTKFWSTVITVAYWITNQIEIFNYDQSGFVSVYKTSEPLSSLVRSVLLYNFGSQHSSKAEDYHPYLLAGLSDGSAVSFSYKDRQLKDKKVISLGNAPVNLAECLVDGKRVIFAAGNRSTALSFEKKRLICSPIMLKEISAVSSLNTNSFASSLMLAAPTGLFIGQLRELDKIHIRNMPMGLDNPRCIVYQVAFKAFGVACTRTQPGRVGEPESKTSTFKLLDDTNFSHLGQFNCAQDEEITSLTAVTVDLNEKSRPLFCVGTYVYKPEEKEPTSGRLLFLTASSAKAPSRNSGLELSLMASTDVKGCVYALSVVGDRIIAAVNSSVMLFAIRSDNDTVSSRHTVDLLAEWNHNYLVTSLSVYNETVVAGDQISSISLLQVVDRCKFQSIARDYGPLWPICVEASDEKHVITANDALNLVTFSLTRTSGRLLLERDGSYHIADLVTKIVRGSLATSDTNTTVLNPQHLFFTSSGRIGVIIDITDDQLALHLTGLQRNLANTIGGVGGVSHARFRAPKNGRGSSDADLAAFGFLDGDFLEQFLGLLGSPESIETVMKGHSHAEAITKPADDIRNVLEVLQSLH